VHKKKKSIPRPEQSIETTHRTENQQETVYWNTMSINWI